MGRSVMALRLIGLCLSMLQTSSPWYQVHPAASFCTVNDQLMILCVHCLLASVIVVLRCCLVPFSAGAATAMGSWV
jgi:hypothetical protein